MPLKFRVDSTEPDAADWTIVELGFCGRWFDSSAALKAAYPAGDASCGFSRATGDFLWEAPSRESPRQARRAVSQDHGVFWGNWSFAVFSRSSQGPALSDVRFADERVLYELSLQDALAAYSGDRKDAFFYSDAAWSLSMLSASLEPGVDCPESATFVEATNWYAFEGRGGTAVADATKAFSFYPTCVFEWTEDHTIWRHMENSEKPTVRGLARKTLVVRSIATVGNYDYITDVKLREDGEIEVGVRFAGYLETRHLGANNRDAEAAYSTALHGDLGGPVHSHVACFKVDVDVGGATANALRVTTVGTDATGFNKALATRDVETERTFTSDPKAPTNWRVVDRASTSESGLARGYAIALGSWASTEVLPADHPFVVAMPYAKWHLAVTKFKDGERRPTNPYVQYDGFDDDFGSQNLANYLDGEAILDEDLVAWVSAGKEHVTRREDLPLVSNFGVAFSLVPWNFFATNPAAA
ncbi:deaminating tryptamine:oxygen oxidoreductase [Aureococcus anophagefferens]|uniref:Amine oxidase n=1 Tax=Aureococcus anophagefferens TaxID=44056 RepID=A0ABR1FZ20_AURAN